MPENRDARDHVPKDKIPKWCFEIWDYSGDRNLLVVLSDNPENDKEQ